MNLNRIKEAPWLDDPSLGEHERMQAIAGMARFNRLSGIGDVLFHRLERFASNVPGRPLKVLDLESGSADLPIHWAVKAKRRSVDLQITASDHREAVLEQHRQAIIEHDVDVHSAKIDCLNHPLPSGFDVIVCSDLMHQLEEPQVFRLLQSMQQSAGLAMVVCDFERTRWNFTVAKTASRLLTRSRVLQHDTPLRIRAAYTREEFSKIANAALCRTIMIRAIVPCRMLAVASEVVAPVPAPAFA
ncbi:methyltransferase domain-containing protein [Novipirellula aureliae]|nr:methyltransferase domain-containing protein [Novipirellula aureliae]